jgi:hypothetical protein
MVISWKAIDISRKGIGIINELSLQNISGKAQLFFKNVQ